MLGIIDWGIGGISIYKVIKDQLGDVPMLYFSDTGATPYGKMARRELAERLDTVINILKKRGASHIVIGCNAASTAIPDLSNHGIPVDGVIEPAINYVSRLKPTRLGLIGGRRTVISGAYRRGFASLGIGVEQRIAQPLSGLIESGDVSSDELKAEAKRILSPLRDCSHVLLACTHYPAIESLLKGSVSSSTRFIDPAAAVVRKLRGRVQLTAGEDQIFTTGSVQMMKSSALLAFGVELPKIQKLKV